MRDPTRDRTGLRSGAPGKRVPAPTRRTDLTTGGLGFAAGTCAFYFLPELPPVLPLVVAAILLGAASWRLSLLRPLALAVLGLLLAQIHACRVLCVSFPEHLIGVDVEVTGVVASLPAEKGSATRFLFQVERARQGNEDLELRGRVRLSWYRDAPRLLVGERRRLLVRLKPAHGLANPAGFDYERWLFQQGIQATGHVRRSEGNRLLHPGPSTHLVNRWRQLLRDHITSVLGDSSATGLVQALVLGERTGLEPEQWDVLTRTGTNHLIAISALHVGLIATFVFFLFRLVSFLS